MVARTCPHYGVPSHFTFQGKYEYSENPYDETESFTAILEQCDNCGMPICGVYGPDAQDDDEVTIWPVVVGRMDYPDVPEAIARAAREAHQALAASAPRASVVMARATIEATAKDKGITSGTLVSKIEKLHAAGHVSEAMEEAADEIRLAGNEVAHSDIVAEQISIPDPGRSLTSWMRSLSVSTRSPRRSPVSGPLG
jgi:uncharacterized protein DUF4145